MYGFDDDLLAMVPQPSLALLLCFPITEATEDRSKKQAEAALDAGPDVFFMHQYVPNACGTIALLHTAMNNCRVEGDAEGKGEGNQTDLIPVARDSYLGKFLSNTMELSPTERGNYLEEDEELEGIHAEAAQEGTSAVPSAEDNVDLHFIAFVLKNGRIVELDGRKHGPVPHGESTRENFLKDAIEVVKKDFISTTGDIRFTTMSFGKLQGDEE